MAKSTKTSKPVPGSQGKPITKDADTGEVQGPASVAPSTATAVQESPQDDVFAPSDAVSTAESAQSAPEVESAAPASVVPQAPAPVIPTVKRSPKAGAIELVPPIPNEFTGHNAEHMMEPVVVLCLDKAKISIKLQSWTFEDRVSYIVPRWFALTHKKTFVIKGD